MVTDRITDSDTLVLYIGEIMLAMAKRADQCVIASRSRSEVDLYRSASELLQAGAEKCLEIASSNSTLKKMKMEN